MERMLGLAALFLLTMAAMALLFAFVVAWDKG
jgi:hypothetical protein